ncbi:hypothetical protein RND81_06G248900 [Saponaria officinalis]|uniref:protein-serine/threonine phosphatase n=1 Tax=Saponaria officinalis TaxID=3572 RepID=A0AAW1KEJ2_SAPOF
MCRHRWGDMYKVVELGKYQVKRVRVHLTLLRRRNTINNHHIYILCYGGSSSTNRAKIVTKRKRKLLKANNTRLRVRRRSSSMDFSSTTPSASSQESLFGILVADKVNKETGQQSMNNNQPTVQHGLISVVGRRRSMEDAFTVVPNLLHLTQDEQNQKKKEVDHKEAFYDFFAVFDGHGGHEVSHKCRERLHHLVGEEAARWDREVNWDIVMTTSFARMDSEVAQGEGEGEREGEGEAGSGGGGGNSQGFTKTVGSTALVVVVGKEEIVVANCGDCRVVLFRDGAALPLSRDHLPERPDEKQRVEEAGGYVVEDSDGSLVLGVLSTSRSIGHYRLKPYVISEPEVQICKRSASDDFVVIATDGVWDVLNNETVCDLVGKCFSGQVSRKVSDGVLGNCSEAAAAMVAELAIARGSKDKVSDGVLGNCSTAAAAMVAELAIARGSIDNISVIVVQLKKFNSNTGSFTK